MNSAFISAPEDDMAVVPTDGPGGHLRTARQAASLTQSQLAKQLDLTPAIIEALEWEAHEALPGTGFVTGYIRKYARLVGLAPEPLRPPIGLRRCSKPTVCGPPRPREQR